jgi:hypothetical protein
VYSYLLSARRVIFGKRAQLLVIGTDTGKPTMNEVRRAAACHEDSPVGEPPSIRRGPYLLSDDVRSLVDDILVKNRRTYTFDTHKFRFRRPYVLLRNTDFSGLFEDRGIQGWDVFYEKFSGAEGFKELSRIGFNPEMTKALVYVISEYTTIDTFTTFVLLKKEGGVWQRVDAYTCNHGPGGIEPEVP